MFILNRRWLRFAGTVTELAIFCTSLAFLFTLNFGILVVWIIVASLYIIGGFLSAWDGASIDTDEITSMRSLRSWTWVLPVLAAAIGAVSAVASLVARSAGSSGPENLTFMTVSSLGAIFSWVLLQVGFAQIYLILDVVSSEEDMRFPDNSEMSFMNYLYFSFTLGTSFATSDVEVISNRIRRIVLIHSVLSFFYNALVVAVAFQVLQGIATD